MIWSRAAIWSLVVRWNGSILSHRQPIGDPRHLVEVGKVLGHLDDLVAGLLAQTLAKLAAKARHVILVREGPGGASLRGRHEQRMLRAVVQGDDHARGHRF